MSLTNFGVATNLVTIGTAILPSSTSPTISLPPTNTGIDKIILSAALPESNNWMRGFSLFSDPFMAMNSETCLNICTRVGILSIFLVTENPADCYSPLCRIVVAVFFPGLALKW
jgi:hypothetical protein